MEYSKSVDSEEVLRNSIPRTSTTTDWPLNEIKEPHKNDVLYGRGGGTNHHPGNKRYRTMVECRKVDYVNSKRLDKPLVALEIIKEWRTQDPPGRFLKMDENTGLWCDVGDKKAREKTSQALREKAPQLRKQQDDLDFCDGDGSPSVIKSTRFDAHAKKGMVDLPLTLQRDHSLGRDYLETSERKTVAGFSWASGLPCEDRRPPTTNSSNNWATHPPQHVAEGVPINHYNGMTSPARQSQQHSNYTTSDPVYTTSSNSNGWGSGESNPVSPVRSARVDYEWPPPPMEATPGSEDTSPARWEMEKYRTEEAHLHNSPRDQELPSTSEVNRSDGGDLEQHDYSQVVDILDNPESNWKQPGEVHLYRGAVEYDEWASPARAAPQSTAGGGGGHNTPRHSNQYNIESIEPLTVADDDPYSPHAISGPRIATNNHFVDEFPCPKFHSNHVVVSPSEGSTPSTTPRSNMHSSDSSTRRKYQSNNRHHGHNSTPVRKGKSNLRKPPSLQSEVPYFAPPNSPDNLGRSKSSCLPKPPPVKRDTSNQNESADTKPSVKKMNRQRSIGNRLPSTNLDKVSEKEVASLGNCLEQSSLENDIRIHDLTDDSRKFEPVKLKRPDVMRSSDRASTFDSFAMAIDANMLSLGETGDIEVPPDYGGDEKDDDDNMGPPTNFSFPEPPEGTCQTSDIQSLPPSFMLERFSSLGSIDKDFANAERV